MFVAGWAVNALDIDNSGSLYSIAWLALAVGFIGIATVVLVPSSQTRHRCRGLETAECTAHDRSDRSSCRSRRPHRCRSACSPSSRNDNSAPVEVVVDAAGTSDVRSDRRSTNAPCLSLRDPGDCVRKPAGELLGSTIMMRWLPPTVRERRDVQTGCCRSRSRDGAARLRQRPGRRRRRHRTSGLLLHSPERRRTVRLMSY